MKLFIYPLEKETPMTFLNLLFLFLFSLLPIHLVASEPQAAHKIRSIQASRNSSPVVEVRADSEEFESVMFYDYPNCKDVHIMRVRKSLPSRASSTCEPVKSVAHSLPDESKLAQTKGKSLSESTERFDLLKQQIDSLKHASHLRELLTTISQKLQLSSENPS